MHAHDVTSLTPAPATGQAVRPTRAELLHDLLGAAGSSGFYSASKDREIWRHAVESVLREAGQARELRKQIRALNVAILRRNAEIAILRCDPLIPIPTQDILARELAVAQVDNTRLKAEVARLRGTA